MERFEGLLDVLDGVRFLAQVVGHICRVLKTQQVRLGLVDSTDLVLTMKHLHFVRSTHIAVKRKLPDSLRILAAPTRTVSALLVF
jgi:hypothetical protein